MEDRSATEFETVHKDDVIFVYRKSGFYALFSLLYPLFFFSNVIVLPIFF